MGSRMATLQIEAFKPSADNEYRYTAVKKPRTGRGLATDCGRRIHTSQHHLANANKDLGFTRKATLSWYGAYAHIEKL